MSILMYHLPTYEHTLQRDRTRRLQHTVRSHATTKHALPIEYYHPGRAQAALQAHSITTLMAHGTIAIKPLEAAPV